MNRNHDKEVDNPVELESQFILRMPPEPAKVLREALANGAVNFKDRFTIKLENDVRYGEVRVDHWLMSAKVVDIPTIIESLKTIDNKSFYKTADICQMVICKEDDDQHTDEDNTQKSKKKDPNKVDKKFLWPHGVTPPTKNVRRRRFRKTLKKKYVEAPEIEKEVKRLLRVDNDAASVKWEVISEDDELKVNKGVVVKIEKESHIPEETGLETSNLDQQGLDIEHDIFGGAVSDSDEDETNINVLEMDENSRLSADDSRLSDSNSIPQNMIQNNSLNSKSLLTEFSCDMFPVESDLASQSSLMQNQQNQNASRNQSQITNMSNMQVEPMDYQYNNDYQLNTYLKSEPANMYMDSETKLTKEQIYDRMSQLEIHLADLRTRREQQEVEIVNIENHALKQRFQEILDNLLQELFEKEQEYEQYREMLKNDGYVIF